MLHLTIDVSSNTITFDEPWIALTMRLINVNSKLLEEFFGDDIPPYAILSHTWGRGEVSYQDWQDPQAASRKAGYSKIISACEKAKSHGLTWLWVDTNCIDKTSSAELTEAINSMFQWYAKSKICYAYLSDVVTCSDVPQEELMRKFRKSRWFTRGWTLQELLAPSKLKFYTADWSQFGRREQSLIAAEISSVTSINTAILTGDVSVKTASIARKMSWLSNRVTTRTEDMAYCMLGLFNINMPLLYGEGEKAFTRLQEEIIKISNDHTIFCWSWTSSVPNDWVSLLAPSPDTYRYSGNFVRNDMISEKSHHAFKGVSTYTMTNAGLSIQLPVIRTFSFSHYMLALHAAVDPVTRISSVEMPCIPVAGERRDGVLYLARTASPPQPVIFNHDSFVALAQEPLLIRARLDSMQIPPAAWKPLGKYRSLSTYGILPLCDSTVSRESESELYSRTVMIPRFERHNSMKIGCVILNLGYQKLNGTAKGQTVTRIFIAARVSKDLTEWFCQIFVQDHIPDETDDEKILRAMDSQVLKAKFEQTAHYNKYVGMSAVIGNEIDPFGSYRHVRVLHISKGKAQYKCQANMDSNWGHGVGTADEESDADSNVAIAQSKNGWTMDNVPTKGRFELKKFS
ncbi:HET-domain-containing protein [Hypoxylon rubiginosum]|uniref:HET-domain-containing protein n=1 Tax=Hypoxylon rubiginosum TaxID=110542 RepID=A0ACC0CXM9_9PEZI|nr:HET-domain-containing protein [Hypoxylon rubiginosum]